MQRNRFTLISGDLFAFLFAYALGGIAFWEIRHSEDLYRFFYSGTLVYLVVVPLGVAWFYLKGHYTRRWPFWDELRGVWQVLFALTIVDGALIFLIKSSFSRLWFITTFTTLFVLLPVVRKLVKLALLKSGKWPLATVIVGTGDNASEVVEALSSERLMGFDIKFFWALDDAAVTEYKGIPVRHVVNDFEATLSKEGIHCVIVALDDAVDNGNGQGAFLEKLHRYTLDLYVVPAFRGIPLYGMELHHFFRHEVIMMRVRNNLLRPVVRFFKRSFDMFGAAFLILLFSPLLLILGGLVRMDGGPAFYGHKRVGLKGTSFKCLKFRSMVENAEDILRDILANDPEAKAQWEKDHKLRNDPRITKVGSFLRCTSLDELPQLWNVIKGEMSLVGPRPLVQEELHKYGDQVDYYLRVRPGMTGLWQVSGRNEVDYNHRVYLDVWYVKNWSLWYDIAILMKTFRVVLNKQGAY